MTHQTEINKPSVTGAHEIITTKHVAVQERADEVSIIVTQAFGPKGDNMVGVSDVTFDGYPAVTVLVKAGDKEGLVHLSPIHGDTRKVTDLELEPGTVCQLFCPVSKEPLDHIESVPGDKETNYYALYLTKQLSKGSLVMISNIWGHYHSRIVDNFELISSWINEKHTA